MYEKQGEISETNVKADREVTRQTIYRFPRPLFAKNS